ncbi:MAG: alpha/beta hydrolase [Candidatus Dormibacteraeota bacterium]|nr:alpha/beta hydrolase [Candidatus Dormibacteraeota bacterium]
MTFITAPDGVQLHYEIEGDGPPLVLFLGAGCDSELWRVTGYVEPLAKSYRCILFDHRGHGRSDRPRGAEANHINRYVADLVALLDHLGVERAAFWGYSSGVTVGLKVAQEHPTRITAFVGSSGVSNRTPEEIAEMVASAGPVFREYGWEKLIANFDEQEPEPVPEWMKERIRATDTQQFIDWWEAMPDWNWRAWESLPHVVAPTLFVVGELEDPDDTTGKAAALMPNGTRLRVSGQGHINAFIRSSVVLPELIAFLAKHAE